MMHQDKPAPSDLQEELMSGITKVCLNYLMYNIWLVQTSACTLQLQQQVGTERLQEVPIIGMMTFASTSDLRKDQLAFLSFTAS